MGIVRHRRRPVILPNYIPQAKRINQIIRPYPICNNRRSIPKRIIDILKRPLRRHRFYQTIFSIVGIVPSLRPIHNLNQIPIRIIGMRRRSHRRILIQIIRHIILRHPILHRPNPIPRRIIHILQILIHNTGIRRNQLSASQLPRPIVGIAPSPIQSLRRRQPPQRIITIFKNRIRRIIRFVIPNL